MLILTGIDGTFKQAKNLTVGGAKFPGVYMTLTNQKGKIIHVPIFVASESGKSMIGALVKIYIKCLEHGAKFNVKKYKLVICLDDFKTHKHLPQRMKQDLESIEIAKEQNFL